MLVLYMFCALMGALFAALSWLRVGPAAALASAEGVGAKADGDAGADSRPAGSRRIWALPLGVFGLLGLTLHLLDRPPEQTLLWSALMGLPVGLLAGWVSGRFNRD